MAQGLRMLLALGVLLAWATVESPPRQPYCGDGEYYHSGTCCKNCPAGTHVDEPCLVPHTLGHCAACTAGEDYTAYDNGLETCLPCAECKPGTTMVKPCTVKSNTECQCNNGYYCPPDCEECRRCRIKCPEGQIIVRNCSATADMECGPAPAGTLDIDYMPILYAVGALAAFSFAMGIIWKICICYRKKGKSVNNHLNADSTSDLLPSWKNTDAFRTESPEVQPSLVDPASVSRDSDLPERSNLPLSSTTEMSSSEAAPLLRLAGEPDTYNSKVLPSNTEHSAVSKPSHDELSEICEELTNKVLVHDWTTLMRKAGLSDNEIDIITHDHCYDTREQKYRMLKTLCDMLGPEKALCKLLNGLQQMKLTHIYENLRNELLSKNIRIVEDKGKCNSFVKNTEQHL